jgi:hypothetical protein
MNVAVAILGIEVTVALFVFGGFWGAFGLEIALWLAFRCIWIWTLPLEPKARESRRAEMRGHVMEDLRQYKDAGYSPSQRANHVLWQTVKGTPDAVLWSVREIRKDLLSSWEGFRAPPPNTVTYVDPRRNTYWWLSEMRVRTDPAQIESLGRDVRRELRAKGRVDPGVSSSLARDVEARLQLEEMRLQLELTRRRIDVARIVRKAARGGGSRRS